jgi:hypothetical protein
MAWERVHGTPQDGGSSQERSPIEKWNQTGSVVEGIWRGYRTGKFGPLAIIETSSGKEQVCGTTPLLLDRLNKFMEGDKIKIEYCGNRQSPTSGRVYKLFAVDREAAPAPKSQPKIDWIEFNRLVGLIRADKNHTIAEALSAAAKATGDPVQGLRDAMDQIGTPQF